MDHVDLKTWGPFIVAIIALLGTTIAPFIAGWLAAKREANKVKQDRRDHFMRLTFTGIQDADREVRLYVSGAREVIYELTRATLPEVLPLIAKVQKEMGEAEKPHYIPPSVREAYTALQAGLKTVVAGFRDEVGLRPLTAGEYLKAVDEIESLEDGFHGAVSKWLSEHWDSTFAKLE